MKIWIDADACPRVIKEILFKASERLKIPVCLVANKTLAKHNTDLVTSIVVDDGPDVADDYIVEHAISEDLVVTADIPLAARIVANGGVAIDPRGALYTEENVGEIGIRQAGRQLNLILAARLTLYLLMRKVSCTVP